MSQLDGLVNLLPEGVDTRWLDALPEHARRLFGRLVEMRRDASPETVHLVHQFFGDFFARWPAPVREAAPHPLAEGLGGSVRLAV